MFRCLRGWARECPQNDRFPESLTPFWTLRVNERRKPQGQDAGGLRPPGPGRVRGPVVAGGGATLAAPARGLALEVNARTLVTHEALGFGECELAGTLRLDPHAGCVRLDPHAGRVRGPAAGVVRGWLPVYAWPQGPGCSGGTAYTPRSAASAVATISGANGSPERCLCRSHSR